MHGQHDQRGWSCRHPPGLQPGWQKAGWLSRRHLATKVWDAQSGRELYAIESPRSGASLEPTAYIPWNKPTFSPDGTRLATLSRDNSVKIWDAQTGRELLSLPVKGVRVAGCVAFSPDIKRLASSSANEIKLWNALTGEELLTLQGQRFTNWIDWIAISPDGGRLNSGAGNGLASELRLRDAQTGEKILTFDKMGGGGVAFGPDGHLLAGVGPEGLKILDATPLQEKPWPKRDQRGQRK